jgi:hypothetical protein
MIGLLAAQGGLVAVTAIIAIILAIWGIVTLLRGGVVAGIVLLILAAAIGPGGWWIFR